MSGLREARAWLFLAAGLVLAVLTGVALYGVAQQTSGGKAETPVSTSTTQVLVAFPANAPLTLNGLVSVGDKVDILATVAAGTGDTARATQTTLQNLEVLDILGPTKEQPSRATALVFAVDHQVAIVLKYLRDSQAVIDLAIRSRAETQVAKTTSVDLGYITSTYGIKR